MNRNRRTSQVANADQLIELLHEAKARAPGAERECFLAESCRDDAGLKEQLVSLLEADADEQNSGFLNEIPVVRPAARVMEQLGDRIGRYKLLEQIGEGGCGVVYMADQEEPVRRRVALKIIKLGMDTRQVVARFEAERQALALMEHTNIAKVFDAGATDTGRPFFVMELVRGLKITDYCDQQNLTTEARLTLFTHVCQAVQHAHQKGIIHRDIKPSNVLVTVNDGVALPKIIDFGIAKATQQRLTEHTLFTGFEQFVGTPAYMSPEQVEMTSVDIDTRTDIYSLGILLYELLIGRTPFNVGKVAASGVQELRRVIRETEPVKPSAQLCALGQSELVTVAAGRQLDTARLVHRVRGDLDWIVMKCLEKDRARRYETANELAMDIRRHLESEPVTARPPTQWYRMRKLVQRHKLAISAAASVSVALIVGLCVATWALVRERAARTRSEEAQRLTRIEATKSEKVARMLRDMLHGVGPAVRGDTQALHVLLTETAGRLDELEGEPGVQADILTILGSAFSEIGDANNARTMHRRALELRRALYGDQHPDVAQSLRSLVEALKVQDLDPEADELVREVQSSESGSSTMRDGEAKQ